jgi:predicted urease superfamily metal-dependent hydrolase
LSQRAATAYLGLLPAAAVIEEQVQPYEVQRRLIGWVVSMDEKEVQDDLVLAIGEQPIRAYPVTKSIGQANKQGCGWSITESAK